MSFEKFIFDRFGIDLGNEICIAQGERVYITNKETAQFTDTQRRGLYAGKMESIYGPKPSLDFVLCYGHLATKNKVVLDDESIKQLYHGEYLDTPCEETGLIIVLDSKGRGAALGFADDIALQTLVPKQRQIVKTEKEGE